MARSARLCAEQCRKLPPDGGHWTRWRQSARSAKSTVARSVRARPLSLVVLAPTVDLPAAGSVAARTAGIWRIAIGNSANGDKPERVLSCPHGQRVTGGAGASDHLCLLLPPRAARV